MQRDYVHTRTAVVRGTAVLLLVILDLVLVPVFTVSYVSFLLKHFGLA